MTKTSITYNVEDKAKAKFSVKHGHDRDYDMEIVEKIEGVPIFECVKEDCDVRVIAGMIGTHPLQEHTQETSDDGDTE